MAVPSSSSLTSPPSDRTLKVLSFNVWGLAIIAKERKTRIRAIAQYLASSSYDIVCLQECWVYKDFELIRDQVVSILPYSRFFNSGALGSGLTIFTRYPLISARVMPYDLSGTPQQAVAGDFFVNKSAANVVVLHPILGELEIWTTHMHAGGDQAPNTRQAHRIGEAWQLANALKSGAGQGRYVMAMGDFNAQPASIPIDLIRQHAGMTDTFLETHPHANTLENLPITPEIAQREYGMSCDSSLNTWSGSKNISQAIKDQGGKRLDYIFYRQPGGYSSKRKRVRTKGDNTDKEESPRLRCVKCELVLTDLVPGHSFSYSDHSGLFATFEIDPTPQRPISNPFTSADKSIETPTTFIPALTYNPSSASRTIKPSSLSDLLHRARTIISDYSHLSRRRAITHNRISSACYVVLLGLTVGSAWQPKSYIQPIFTLLGALLGAAGVTFFYFGFLWGKWEAGILSEIIQEMDLEMEVLNRS